MYSPSVLLVLSLGFLLIVAPITGKLFLSIPYLLMVFTVLANEFYLNKRLFIKPNNHLIIKLNYIKKILLFCFVIFLTNLAIKYYTGQTVIGSIAKFLSGEINYNAYQIFFKEEARADFEAIKLLHISTIAFIKLIAFYCIYYILFNSNEKLSSIIFMAPLIVYSISRGTSIEFFEMAVFTFSALYLKSKIYRVKNYITFIASLLLVIAGLYVFSSNISLRMGESVLDNVCFGPFCYEQGLGTSLDPIFFLLSGYFFGGFYNISTYIYGNNIFDVIYPGNIIFSFDLNHLCEKGNSCAAWHPLLPKFISLMGLFAIIPIVFIAKLVNVALYKSNDFFITCLIIYHYTYFIFSIFIGEGIFASNSNILILIFVLIKIFNNRRIQK
jgi:hypothetical protein